MSTLHTTSRLDQSFKNAVASSFSKQAGYYDSHAQVQSSAAILFADYFSRWAEAGSHRRGAAVEPLPAGPLLEIGCGTGFLTSQLLTQFPNRDILVSDISPSMVELCKSKMLNSGNYNSRHIKFAVLDGENLPADARYAAIFTSFSMQWFADVRQSLARLSNSLHAAGKLFYCIPGSGTFKQWRELCATLSVPFTGNELPGKSDLMEWANSAGLACVVNEHVIDCCYPDMHSMLRSLKQIGAATPRSSDRLTVSQMRRLLNAHKETVSDDRARSSDSEGRPLTVSYQILYGCMTK